MATRPELDPDLHIVWKVFNELHRCRTVGFSGANPVSISEINALLDLYGIHNESRLEYFEFISALDDEWLDWARKQDRDAEKK